MITSRPSVSVCIPTYNRAEMLREAIQSVLAQTLNDFELIISDNASNDHTRALVSSFRDKRIRYMRHDKTLTPVGNFNYCLAVAAGTYVTIFHDDDIMLPDNLLFKAQALDRNPRVGLVHSKFHVIDEDGTILQYNTNCGQPQTRDSVETGHDFLKRNLLGFNLVNPPSAMMRTACYTELGGFNEELSYSTDWEYWMRISLNYDVMCLATPLLKYRIHPRSGTSQFTSVLGRRKFVNIRGLGEEFAAKRLTLHQAKHVIADWINIRGEAWTRMRAQLVSLGEMLWEENAFDRKTRLAIISMCWRFPEILADKAIMKVVLKALLGPHTIHAAKRWVARFATTAKS